MDVSHSDVCEYAEVDPRQRGEGLHHRRLGVGDGVLEAELELDVGRLGAGEEVDRLVGGKMPGELRQARLVLVQPPRRRRGAAGAACCVEGIKSSAPAPAAATNPHTSIPAAQPRAMHTPFSPPE